MSEFPTHSQPESHYRDNEQARPEPKPEPERKTAKAPAAKPPAGMDTRSARAFARRVLSTRAVLDTVESGDVAILERVSGERKATKGNLDELAVVLATSTGGSGKDILTATRDLLSKVTDSPMEAVVEATMLAAESPEVFREVFSLTRELGVHDTPRAPSGHEVKAASALVQAAQNSNTAAAMTRLEALTDLLG
ncbi:hypothetical protein [Ornithinimicrobium murale]|uniref:hypothetical protein n=1 Tax=Ornithinimicrobium murale TaxID=1050153 RepID=UPI000E0DC6B9|nr:hypothetical protein [Ornithinimicrobium murale]